MKYVNKTINSYQPILGGQVIVLDKSYLSFTCDAIQSAGVVEYTNCIFIEG